MLDTSVIAWHNRMTFGTQCVAQPIDCCNGVAVLQVDYDAGSVSAPWGRLIPPPPQRRVSIIAARARQQTVEGSR